MGYAIAILAIGILIALHELGHFWAARVMGMKVERFSVGFLFPILKWTSKRTGIVYQIGALPLGGFVQIKGMNPFEDGAFEDPASYQLKSAWRRAFVILAGPATNFLIAFALYFGLGMAGLPEDTDESGVGAVVAGDRADEAGLRPGDAILEVDGERTATWDDLVSRLEASPEREVTLLVRRGDADLTIAVKPRDVNGLGKVGIFPPTRLVHLPPLTAARASLGKCVELISGTFEGLAGLISGASADVSPVGPVGIVRMAAAALSTGLNQFLSLMAYLSVMLFMFNLFPLPALDGGRGIFLLYEAVTRRRVNKKVDAVVNTVGFFLLIGLLLLITAKELFFG
jgi:regulator of sigma E protease